MRFRYILFGLQFLFLLYARDMGSVEGQLFFEDSGLPVQSATVTLILAYDDSIVTGTVTNEIGNFKIDNISFQ